MLKCDECETLVITQELIGDDLVPRWLNSSVIAFGWQSVPSPHLSKYWSSRCYMEPFSNGKSNASAPGAN